MGRNSKRPRKRERGGRPRDASEEERTSDGCSPAWRKVDVGLSEDAVVPGNHYDPDEEAASEEYGNEGSEGDPMSHRSRSKEGKAIISNSSKKKRRRRRHLDADQDLEATGGEEMGFFFGLEVISSNDYELETDPTTGTRRFRVLKDTSEDEKKETTKEASPVSPMKVERDVKASAATSNVKRAKPTPENSAAAGDVAKDESRASDRTISKSQEEEDDSEVVSRMQIAWLSATGGVELHPVLCRGLVALGFWTPTPIQAATLPAAILGQRNIVGAAPTGSGKTLSYLLPILHELLDSTTQAPTTKTTGCLQALILSPTRELALQIQQACESLVPRASAAIVGGLAVAKQTRLLDRKPPVVIGTPGRLWDLISKRAHPHLRDLSQVHHLVIDEADRMIQQGSFPELSRIFDAVHLANPMDDEMDDDDDVNVDDEEGEMNHRLVGLPGLPGEARVEMLNADILEAIERQRVDGAPTDRHEESDEEAESANEESDEEAESAKSLDHETSQLDEENDSDDSPLVIRRTYVYSATLTLPATSSTYKKRRRELDVDGAIAEILEKSRARGQTKIVDLTSSVGKKKVSRATAGGESGAKKPDGIDSFQLPPGLSLHQIKCTQKHKDSHLYAYLMTTEQGAKGPCLVFCNSIAGVRRVGATLTALGSDVRILHAQMQQRARFKAVESLQKSSNRAVVVATDVAARGLDIPSVASVVHYDIPRTVDVFVHRSGRTARGVGEGAVGSCLSLVSPSDDKNYARIMHGLKVNVQNLHMDGRLLRAAQARVSLACKVVSAEGDERKVQSDKKWFQDQAAEAGLEVDDTLLESNSTSSRNRKAEARRARAQLAQLLSQPMQTQRYGKFLSTNSSHTSTAIPSKAISDP